jgi:hypothetical protein
MSENAERDYVNWDRELFSRFCQYPIKYIAEDLDRKAIEGYLTLIREAILCGYLTGFGSRQRTFQEHCLVHLLSNELCQTAEKKRPALMVKVWNLCEGLSREPAWVNQYVMSRSSELEQLTKLSTFLANVLKPVLTPMEKSCWGGSFKLTQLNTRAIDDDFLPGPMMLTAPAVLAIQDRRRDTRLSVLLQRDGKSQLLGLSDNQPSYHEDFARPAIEVKANEVLIGDHRIALPHLQVVEQSFMTETGFFVSSAADSQQLWIVESQ